MRLTCPNCGAEYEVPEGMIPAGGKHVQCTACHTRWFMRGTARAALTEDQVLTRLENWSSRPRLVPVPAAVAEPEPETGFVWETPPARPTAPVPPTPVADPPAADPRTRPRIEISTEMPVTRPRPLPRPRNRFRPGLLLGVGVCAFAALIYVGKDTLSRNIPATAPVLTDYAAAIDAAREWIDDQVKAWRSAPES